MSMMNAFGKLTGKRFVARIWCGTEQEWKKKGNFAKCEHDRQTAVAIEVDGVAAWMFSTDDGFSIRRSDGSVIKEYTKAEFVVARQAGERADAAAAAML